MEEPIKSTDYGGYPEPVFFTSTDSAADRDERVWNAMRAGSREALDFIFQQHSSGLFSYGSRFTRDKQLVLDAIQDLFVELWNRRQNLGHTNCIRFYLLKALRRRVARAMLGAKRFEMISEDLQYAEDTIGFSAEHLLVEEETRQNRDAHLKNAIEGLTRRQRESIYLKFFQGLENQSIAAIMGLTTASVSTLLSQAVKALRTSLG